MTFSHIIKSGSRLLPIVRHSSAGYPSFANQVLHSRQNTTNTTALSVIPHRKLSLEETMERFRYRITKCGNQMVFGFDFDGTLVATKALQTQALKEVCQLYGVPFPYEYCTDPIEQQNQTKLFLYNDPNIVFSGLVGKAYSQQAAVHFKKIYQRLCMENTGENLLMPGIQELFETFEKIRKGPVKLGIYVSSHSPAPIVEHMIGTMPENIKSQIDVIQGSGGSLPAKPDPIVRPLVLDKKNIGRGIYIPHGYLGDGKGDIEAGGSKADFIGIRPGTLYRNNAAFQELVKNKENVQLIPCFRKFAITLEECLRSREFDSAPSISR